MQAFQAGLDKVRAQLGRTYPLMIGGEKIFTDDMLESRNPAKPTEVVGRVSQATPELADRAVREAARAFEHWQPHSLRRAGALPVQRGQDHARAQARVQRV